MSRHTQTDRLQLCKQTVVVDVAVKEAPITTTNNNNDDDDDDDDNKCQERLRGSRTDAVRKTTGVGVELDLWAGSAPSFVSRHVFHCASHDKTVFLHDTMGVETPCHGRHQWRRSQRTWNWYERTECPDTDN